MTYKDLVKENKRLRRENEWLTLMLKEQVAQVQVSADYWRGSYLAIASKIMSFHGTRDGQA